MEPYMDDDLLRKMFQKSAGPIPFPDFEEEIMKQIDAREIRRESIRTNLKLSWFFFALGMVAGMFLMIILPDWHDITGGIDTRQITCSFLVTGCLLVVTLLVRNLLALTRKYKR